MDDNNKSGLEIKNEVPQNAESEVKPEENIKQPTPSGTSKLKAKIGSFSPGGLKTKLFGNKKLLLLSAGVLVLVIALGVYALSNPDSSFKPSGNKLVESPKITAKVSYVTGTLERKDGDTYTSLKLDDELQEGDSIRTTGATSFATIALGNGSFTRMDGDTEITLTAIRENEVVIMQENGKVYSRVSPASSGTYTVETNKATFLAAGTAFKTTSGGDEESVEVYESKVDVTSDDKTVNQGEKLFIKNVQDTAKEGKVEALDIEAVKADSFVVWCRSEDEKSDEFKDKLGFLSDVTAPELSVTSPKNGSTITVEASATSGSVAFTGKTDPGSTLTIQSLSVSGSAPVAVTVGADGNFTSEEIHGIIGASQYEVIAKDPAGNKNKQTFSITFKKKSTTSSGITLSYVGKIDGKFQVSWSVPESFIDGEGFKVVWGLNTNPTYPGDNEKVFVAADERNLGLSVTPVETSKTYYVRVCRYSGGACDLYSNQVSFTVPAI